MTKGSVRGTSIGSTSTAAMVARALTAARLGVRRLAQDAPELFRQLEGSVHRARVARVQVLDVDAEAVGRKADLTREGRQALPHPDQGRDGGFAHAARTLERALDVAGDEHTQRLLGEVDVFGR